MANSQPQLASSFTDEALGFSRSTSKRDRAIDFDYGGHAKADYRRGRSIWQANGQPDSPHLNWSSLQSLLETAVPHVLIILDCCFAATAARNTTEGTTKEILAACGTENPTHGVGQRSFTSALIEEMQAFGGAPFTAAMLHSRLVTMRWRLAFTPIYALLSEHGGNSVTICPLPNRIASVEPDLNQAVELETTEHPQYEHPSMIADAPPWSPRPTKQTMDTRVLLSVSVDQDASHDVSDWLSWLTSAAPWDVTNVDAQVHSVFKSHSTLIIVSIPTSVWDRLPERAAYPFVGFVRSGDYLQAARTSTASISVRPVTADRTAPRQDDYFFHLPMWPRVTFVPRPDLVNKLLEGFQVNKPQTNTAQRLCIVIGIGSAGKSQLVLHYAETSRARYSGIFWIDAASTDSIRRDFKHLRDLLYPDQKGKRPKNPNLDYLLRAIGDWFSQRNERFLLVFDGADNIDNPVDPSNIELRKVVPDHISVDVIVTTRMSSARGLGSFSLEVNQMEEEEALQLLRRSTGLGSRQLRSSEEEEMKSIIEELGYLALAIELTGSYISQTPHILTDLSNHLPEYRSRRRELLEDIPGLADDRNKKAADQYTMSIFSVWPVSFQEAKTLEAAALQEILVRGMAGPSPTYSDLYIMAMDRWVPLLQELSRFEDAKRISGRIQELKHRRGEELIKYLLDADC